MRSFIKGLIGAAVLITLSNNFVQAQAQANVNDVYFQAFGWDIQDQAYVKADGGLYNFLSFRADALSAAGFNVVWMPPPSKSTGGMGYIPTEYFNFNQTPFGTEAQLRTLLNRFKNANPAIHPMADVVVNHRGGTLSWTDFTNPAWGCETICYNDDSGNTQTANYQGCRPTGANDTGDDFSGARDLDHTSQVVQNGVKEYLSRLKELGFDSWRWDIAKGFSSSFFGDYINASNPYASVGEYWDGNQNLLKAWINGTGGKSAAFDFNMYYDILQPALNSGNYSVLASGFTGLAGQFGFADKAVTFIDNHDTFVKPGSIVSNDNIMKGYAYILTHHGIPCVFLPHYYGGTFKKDGVTVNYSSNEIAINKLLAVRKANGINAYSAISVQNSSGYYAAIIDGKVAVKIGPGNWAPTGNDWILNASGNDYAVWSKSAINVTPTLSITPAGGTFATGSQVSVSITALDDKPGTTIYYSTDGTVPSESSSIYTDAIIISNNTNLQAFAKDADGLKSAVVTAQYTFLPLHDLTIHFRPPVSWGNPPFYIHYWQVLSAGSFPDSQWPGKVMEGPDAAGFFKYTLPQIARANFLFTKSSSGPQTVDIVEVTENHCYEASGTTGKLNAVIVDCSPVGIGESPENDKLVLYPNPAENYFAFNQPVIQLQIRSITGKLIQNIPQVTGAQQAIDITNFQSGIYLVETHTANGEKQQFKLVKP